MKLEADFQPTQNHHLPAPHARTRSHQGHLSTWQPDTPHHLAQILTRLSSHLGVCEHLLSSCAISAETQLQLRTSLKQANLEVEMAGSTVRRELQNQHIMAQGRAKSHSDAILKDILNALARRAQKSQVKIHFEESDLALPDSNEAELRYILTGLFATALHLLGTSRREDKRLTISLERENRSCTLKVLSNGPVCAVELTSDRDETRYFVQALSRNGFAEYLKFLAVLQATFRVCSHEEVCWLILRFGLPDDQGV